MKKVKFVRGREGDPISLENGKKIGVIDRNTPSSLRPEIGEEWEVEQLKELGRVIILRPLRRVERIGTSQRGFERVSGKKVIQEIPFKQLKPKEVKWNFADFFSSRRILVEFLYSLEGVEKKVEEVYDLEEAPIPEGAKEEMTRKIREYERKQQEETRKREEEKKIYEEKVKEALKPFRFSTAEDFCRRAVREGFKLQKVLETDSVFRPRLIIVGEEAVFPFPRKLHEDILDTEKVITSRGPVEFPEVVAEAFLSRDYLEILEFLGLLSYREWLNFEDKAERLPRELSEEVTYRQWNESWLLRGKSSKGPGDFEVNPRAEEEAKQRLIEEKLKDVKELTFSSPLLTARIIPEVVIKTSCMREESGGWHPESDDGYRREGYAPVRVEDKAVATASIQWKTEIEYKIEMAREFRERIEERIKE